MGDRPFRFEAAWLLHDGFDDWMEQEWDGEGDLTTTLRNFATKLKAWNKATFGNIFQRKKRNSLRLGGVQRELSNMTSPYLLRLEKDLIEESNLILLQEELLWRQNHTMNEVR